MNGRATEQAESAMQEELSQEPKDSESKAKASYWSKLIPYNLTEIVLLALVVLVISLHLKYLLDVGTALPHQDDWNLLDKMFRALDTHRIGAWVFDSPNGHFLVPAALAHLFSLRYLSLDLTPLRLLNFPICLAAFFLTAHVINDEVRSRFLRFYLYASACLIIFNICFWEHFAQANGFTAILSALFGGASLYYIAKATQVSAKWKNHLLAGLVLLIASVLSLGAGYAAAAAAASLFAVSGLKRLTGSRPTPRYETVVYCVACTFGLLAIASHPLFHLQSWIIKAVFHSVLVAGSVGSSFMDKNTLLAQNVAFVCGATLVVASLSIGFDFLIRPSSRARLLPTFSVALVLFGLFGCVAVAVARFYLPNGEFLNSRYTLYPCICLLGLLFYFVCSKVFLLTHVWCFVAATYLLATVREYQIGFYRPQLYREMERAINNVDKLSDEQLKAALYWRENTKGVRRVTARMRRDRLNVFRGSPDANIGPH